MNRKVLLRSSVTIMLAAVIFVAAIHVAFPSPAEAEHVTAATYRVVQLDTLAGPSSGPSIRFDVAPDGRAISRVNLGRYQIGLGHCFFTRPFEAIIPINDDHTFEVSVGQDNAFYGFSFAGAFRGVAAAEGILEVKDPFCQGRWAWKAITNVRRPPPPPTQITDAPQLSGPSEGSTSAGLQASLAWTNPPGATQNQLQVTPFNGDGPALNLIVNATNNFNLEAPVLGQGPYVLLPDMTYGWRVRVIGKWTPVTEDDAAWGPWSPEKRFRTPWASAAGLNALEPLPGARVAPGPRTAQWDHPNKNLFYWEVQMSGDAAFNTDPASASSFVWTNLVHGGASPRANSWQAPSLGPGVYHWRVRPRIQGDGKPVDWSSPFSFTVDPSIAPSPAPAPAVPSPTSTVPPRPAGKLAFSSVQDGQRDIYVMNPDGTGLRRLTNDAAGDWSPAWSPDRQKIAFVSDRGGERAIFVVTADGGLPVRVGGELGAQEAAPSWSPDGNRITFSSTHGGDPDIFVMNADGRNRTLLTVYLTEETDPSWSPDGSKIAFISTWDDTPDVHVINHDGSDLLRVVSTPGADSDVAWSPDGTRLAFASLVEESNHEIYVVSADGSGLTRLTNHPAADLSPAWSPDGGKIAFASNRADNFEIYVMNTDGTGVTRLTNNPGDDLQPAW